MGKPLKIFAIIIALIFLVYDTIIKLNYYTAIEVITYVILFNLLSDVLIIQKKDEEIHRLVGQRNILHKILLTRARISSKNFNDDKTKQHPTSKKRGKS